MTTLEPPRVAGDQLAAMERNLRILPWWWVLRWVWFGEGVWVIYLVEERGITLGQALVFEALFAGTVLLTELPMGMVADRYGRRVALLLGGVCVSVGFVVFGLGAWLPVLLSAYAILALADTNFSGADTALLFDSLKAVGREADFTKMHGRLNALITLMIGFATIAGSLMVRWVPLSVPMVLSGVCSLPALFLAWRLVEPKREDERFSYLGTGWRAVMVLHERPSIAWASVLMATTTVVFGAVSVLQQPFLIDAGIPIWGVGFFVAAVMVASAAGGWQSASVGHVLSTKQLFLLIPLGSALGLLGMVTGHWAGYATLLVPAVGFSVLFPHFTNYIARRVTQSLTASVLSIANLIAGIGGTIALPLTGVAADRLGFGIAVTLLTVLASSVVGLAALLWLRTGDTAMTPLEAPVRPVDIAVDLPADPEAGAD